MRRLALAVSLLAPLAALAQTWSYTGRASGHPAGLTLPNAGVASGEEPAAMAANPAAAGFNEGFTLQYFKERARGTLDADGLYLGVGPLALSSEWVSRGGLNAYRKLGLGLGLGGPSGALGLAWNGWSSSDPLVGGMRSWDFGLTARPLRHVSMGVAALDVGGRMGGVALPTRWSAGLATRLLGDSLTLSVDWLGDDGGGRHLTSRSTALGLGYESRWGVAVHGQVGIPADRSLPGVRGATIYQLALSLNSPRFGLTFGSADAERRGRESSLLGLRLSSRGYRAEELVRRPVLVDLRASLEPRISILWGAPHDPFGALVSRLRTLGGDRGVSTVVVRVTPLGLAPGHADELRATLLELQARKPVVAFLEGAGLREYYLASAAGRILMLPAGMLTLTGLSSTSLYLKDTLAKAGIGFQSVTLGKYKSAPDALGRSDMAEAEREALDSVLDDLFGRQVKAIAQARGLAEEKVRALVDQGLFSAAAALEAGLVDGLAWHDELGATSAPSEPVERRAAQRWGGSPAVVVVQVAGVIVPGRSRGGLLASRLSGAETVADLVRQAARDRGVRAIVLRVDSPGGDAQASDVIWRALVQARRHKPVVVSMGDLAASGGYWIATGGDAIVAEPSTITGSIGVFAQKPDLSGLLAKLEATQVTLKRGARADIESPFRPWSEAEQEAIRKEVGAVYETFLARVSEARKLPRDQVDKVAQGRIWTGAQALERGLVDRLGSLADAVALAAERAGLKSDQEVEVRRLDPPRRLPWEELEAGWRASADPLGGLLARLPELQAAAGLLEMGTVVALPAGWVEPLASTRPGPSP